MQYELGVVAHRLPLSGVGVLAPSGLTYRNMPVEGVGLRSSTGSLRTASAVVREGSESRGGK